MLTPEQIELRRTGISSSEIAGLLGISPFTDPIKIWIEKCAPHMSIQKQPKRFSVIDMGNVMEPVAARCYCQEFRLTAKKYTETLRHDRIKWMLATPDYQLSNGRGLECKNVSVGEADRWGAPGTDQIPIYYITQVQQCMAVLDRQDWAVAAIIGGNQFRHYLVQRDEELLGIMIETAEKFWKDYVLTKKMPPADCSYESALEYLNKRYPVQEKKETIQIEDDDPLVEKLERVKTLRYEKKLIEDELDAIYVELQTRIQEKHRIIHGDGEGSITASWGKGGMGAATDWKALAEELLESWELDKAEIIQKHTHEFPKKRRFGIRIKGEKSDDGDDE